MGHKARETVALLSQEMPDFIPPSLWSPNCPDLNPVDYKVWGLLQKRVIQSPVKDIDDLQNRVMQEWDRLDLRVIDQATTTAWSCACLCSSSWWTFRVKTVGLDKTEPYLGNCCLAFPLI